MTETVLVWVEKQMAAVNEHKEAFAVVVVIVVVLVLLLFK